MTKQHRDEFQRGRESLHGEMEMLRQINSDLLAALELSVMVMEQYRLHHTDVHHKALDRARACIRKAKGE